MNYEITIKKHKTIHPQYLPNFEFISCLESFVLISAENVEKNNTFLSIFREHTIVKHFQL